MSRYIDADKLLEKWEQTKKELATFEFVLGLQGAINELKNEPTADVVEVVRCENCKHYYWDDETGHYCNIRLVETYNSDFCSDGVRKADTNSGTDLRGEENGGCW